MAILRTVQDGVKSQVDIRGIGIIVAPPSVHENGSTYEWITPPTAEVPEAPPELVILVKRRRPEEKPRQDGNWVQDSIGGVEEGSRNATCARLAGFLLSKGLDRQTVKALLRQFSAGCKPPMPRNEMEDVVDSIWRKDLQDGKSRSILAKPLNDVLHSLYETLYSKPERRVKTGFDKLDWFLCGGLADGELAYLGARPGVGKTAMALQICAHAAKDGCRCLVVSREMSAISMGRRMVSQGGRIDASVLRRMTGREATKDKVIETLDRLSRLPIWITDEASTLEEIAGAMENMGPGGADFLVVDHLQLVRGDRRQDRRHQVEAASRGIKVMSLDYKIPILCMSTLSRAPDKKDQRPTLDSLRESGELEHDADIVLLLHRAFKSTEAECMVAKNRDGHVGTANFEFEPSFLTFTLVQEKLGGTDRAANIGAEMIGESDMFGGG